MPEILLHYIWQKRLFDGWEQRTTDGRLVEVLDVGEHNTDAGPDFSHARIRIDGQEWCGNIEIHVHASDWYKHKHDKDAAYDSVVLHVVRDADKEVLNSQGKPIMQCALHYPDNQDYLAGLVREAELMDSTWGRHACAHKLLKEPTLLTEGWRRTLLKHRLDCKRQSIRRLLAIMQDSWEQAFYISLAHYFGFHTNGIPMEQLALATPLRYLQKHKNSLLQLTAILLGQSGLLETSEQADRDVLWREYCFLQKKFDLTPISAKMWKHARMRPQNAPEVRIRQFAQLLYQSEFLFSRAMEARNMDELVALFRLQPIAPQETAEGVTPIRICPAPPLGKQSIDVLLINVVVPYRYARKQDEAIALLEKIPAEQNSIIRQWQLLGQTVRSAADTQALIHLQMNYCADSRCVNCDVAYQVFLQLQ